VSTRNVDAVIIGGGIGGLITGAILSKKEGMKILLLEKEKYLGGKTFSFEHSEFEPEEFRHLLYALTRNVVIRSDPPIDELLRKKVFRDFVFEGGWHSFIASDRSRMSFILKALGQDLKIVLSRGFRWWADHQWVELRDLMRNWSKAEIQEGREISRKMNLMSLEEASAFDHVDMQSYMRSRAQSPNVRQFHEILAAWEAGLNDPALISTGEHIKAINLVHCSGRDFQYGGGGGPEGGYNNMTRAFAAIIEQNGGIIKTNTPVQEVIIEGYKALGVRAKTSDGMQEYLAPVVICNVPMQRVYPLVPKEYWPGEFAERISRIWPLSGILGWVCTKPPMDPEFGGSCVVPVLPGCTAAQGYRGDVLFTFEDEGVMDPMKVPKGYGLMAVWVGLLPCNPDEIHNKALVDRAVEGMLSFLKIMMPDFKNQVQWYFLTLADEMYSLSVSPGLIGDRRLPVTHPTVKNLYFTGDSITQWSFGLSGAAGGAIHCASAVTGKDQSIILPFYMR